MVAMARYLILDVKEMTDWRILSVTAAIFLLARAVLALRYGDVRLSNCEEASEGIDSPR
jgi:protein PsiE